MLPLELLEYLKTRLGNHSFSISHDNRYKLKFSMYGEACITGAKKIFVPMPTELTKEALEEVYGHEIHETAHLLYGSVEWEKMHKVIDDNNLNPHLAREITNHIEDYRVNTLIGFSHPGAGKLLHRIYENITEREKKEIESPVHALLYELSEFPYKRKFGADGVKKLKKAVALVRGVVGCTTIDDTLNILPDVYKIFVDGMNEQSINREATKVAYTSRRYDAELKERSEAMKPEEEIKRNVEEAMKKAPPPPEPETESEDEPEPETDGSGKSEEGEDSESEDGKGESEDGEEEDGDGDGEDEANEESGDDEESGEADGEDGEEEGDNAEGEPSGSKDVQSATENNDEDDLGLERTLEEAKRMMEEHKRLEEHKRIEYQEIAKEVDCDCHIREIPKFLPDHEYELYANRNSASIIHLVKEAKKVFLFRRGWQQGYKTGKMNSRKVHRVVTDGDQRIFMKKTENSKVGDIAISILVDQSGSMMGNEELFARETAVILHEVFRGVRIKHMIAGYRADRGGVNTIHEIFKHWDDNQIAANLVKIKAGGNNRDGDNIRIATKFFEKIYERKRLLIIISDGQPNAAGYDDEEAIEDTVKAQRDAEKKGIKIINVGIGEGWELPEQYKNRVKVDSVPDLPKKLMVVVRKEIIR